MGTTATPTLVDGPEVVGGAVQATFSLALDTTDANGKQTIDLTDYFGYYHSAIVADVDTTADNAYKFGIEKPAVGTSASSTNLVLTVHYSPAKTGDAENAEAFDPVASTDLGTVGALTLIVRGKAAIVSSWS